MEAFADAAFAIVLALTFLQEVPRSYVDLKAAAWGLIPFAITFVVVVMIWTDHYRFFRRYGLRDPHTFYCNLLLLFLVMVFAFPLKFLFTALFVMWVGPIGDLTPEELFLGSGPNDAYFIILFYSAGFGSIYATLWSMYRNALKCSDELGLDDVERHATVTSIYNCLVYVAFAALSIALIVITEIPPLAGLVYAGIGPAMFVLHFKRDRDHKKLVRERGLDA